MASGTVDGLHYEERGEGPPVLFLHGTGSYGAMWEWTIDALPGARRAIAYDRRGFGASQGRLARGPAEHVRDAAALLRRLGAVPADVVTQSGGAVIALALAARHPELVRSLVLAEPAYAVALHPSPSVPRAMGPALARWLLRRDAVGAAERYYRWASRYTTGGNAYDRYPEEWRRTARSHAVAGLREVLQLTVPAPRPSALRSIRCPVTLAIGDVGEPVFQRTTRRTHRLIAGSRLVPVQGAGHLIPTDQPQAFAAVVDEALRAPA